MSGCRLAIIADDLSGALDTSAPFAARGADVRVVISLEALATTLEAWQGQWPEVIAVNTQSRHLQSEEAALRVSEAVRLLTRVAPQEWFKKVDSTAWPSSRRVHSTAGSAWLSPAAGSRGTGPGANSA